MPTFAIGPSRSHRALRTVLLLAALAWPLASPAIVAADGRFRVCSITINSDDEIRAFRKHLPTSDFEFVELTQTTSSESPPSEPPWFTQTCESKMRCDVLVVSGHFSDAYAGSSGTTFAGKRGLSLALEALEGRSCDQTCPGVLGAPLEVFLFGCRTLAIGFTDRGLRAKDRSMLAERGLSAAEAGDLLEEIRNHGEETSNQRRMRFSFAGVPHIFGFSWTAPTGVPIAPHLEAYFRRVGNYAEHLRQVARRRAAGAPEPPNADLARALSAETFAEDPGFGSADPEYRHELANCFLRSPRSPVGSRLERIATLLDGPGFLRHLAAITVFFHRLDRAELTADETNALERIRGHERARQTALDLVKTLEGPQLRLELLEVSRAIGWMTADDALPLRRDIVRRLLAHPVYGEERDLVCRIDPASLAAIDLRAAELSPDIYDSEFGIAAIACLKPRDPEIQARLGQALSDPRAWISDAAAKAIQAIHPADPQVVSAIHRADSASTIDWP